MGQLAVLNTIEDKAAAENVFDINAMKQSLNLPYDRTVHEALSQHEYNFVLCDPKLPDNPIVYASEGFLKMTGYSAQEVLGRNCRFLQGPDTDRRTVLEIRDAIREERPCQVRIVNYTKQGRAFWNLFYLAPVYSRGDGTVVHFVGVQTPLVESYEAELGTREAVSNITADSAKFASEHDAKVAVPYNGNNGCFDSVVHEDRYARVDVMIRLNSLNSQPRCGEEECEMKEENKCRADTAVRAVLSELTKASKSKIGVAEQRCISLAQSAAVGVVCSSLMLSLTQIQQSFVLADPNLPDMPIVHASNMFLRLTGYSHEEVLGRNCRFLQGPDTDPKSVQKISESIKNLRSCSVKILNYRKDKQPFWNFLYVAPVRSADGKVAYYVGVQLDITLADTYAFEGKGVSAHMKQLGAVGAIRVAVRGLQGGGLRRIQKVLEVQTQ
uniref:Putative LOV domain-containing protein n=1 Tax=Huperzia selago TaxID=70001 RepID=A0A126X429_HUPSE|nr:putative LOV domain-containing protein [Huperzia selago]